MILFLLNFAKLHFYYICLEHVILLNFAKLYFYYIIYEVWMQRTFFYSFTD